MPSLSDERRQFTRRRICAAAREVFALEGLNGATMEQIALAAGTRRSTLYNHFSDKGAILDAIAEDFGGSIVALFEEIPDRPTVAEWKDWVQRAARFAAVQRAPTELFLQLGSYAGAPAALESFGATVFQAFAARSPAFARALARADQAELVRMRATVAVRQLGAACAAHLSGKAPDHVEKLSLVAAELLHAFIGGASFSTQNIAD